MGASLVYLDRPNTKKNTISGQCAGTGSSIGYKYTCSGMQGWRLNMVSINSNLNYAQLLVIFHHTTICFINLRIMAFTIKLVLTNSNLCFII